MVGVCCAPRKRMLRGAALARARGESHFEWVKPVIVLCQLYVGFLCGKICPSQKGVAHLLGIVLKLKIYLYRTFFLFF